MKHSQHDDFVNANVAKTDSLYIAVFSCKIEVVDQSKN